MTQLSVRLIGADHLQVGFNRYVRTVQPITKEQTLEAMRRAKKRSVSDPSGGPYSVPERGYIRTGNLSASTYLVTDGLSVRIESNAYQDGRAYSTYVVGNADGGGQAYMHKGWWVPLRQSVDDELETLEKDIDAKLGESAEALGL